MITDKKKKVQLKSGWKISGKLKLEQQLNLKSYGVNQTPEALFEEAEKDAVEKLAAYYVQLFFLS